MYNILLRSIPVLHHTYLCRPKVNILQVFNLRANNDYVITLSGIPSNVIIFKHIFSDLKGYNFRRYRPPTRFSRTLYLTILNIKSGGE